LIIDPQQLFERVWQKNLATSGKSGSLAGRDAKVRVRNNFFFLFLFIFADGALCLRLMRVSLLMKKLTIQLSSIDIGTEYIYKYIYVCMYKAESVCEARERRVLLKGTILF